MNMDQKTLPDSNILLITVAGLVSGLLTCFFAYVSRGGDWLLMGLPFGVVISICLLRLGIFASNWRAIRLIVVSGFAYFFAFLVAYFFQGIVVYSFVRHGEQVEFSPAAMFVGGLVGGFFVLGEAFSLRMGTSFRALKLALLWSLGGGILGTAGELLAPSLGAMLFSLVYAFHLSALTKFAGEAFTPTQTQSLFSLYVVWQTGTAFLIGMALWLYRPVVAKDTKRP